MPFDQKKAVDGSKGVELLNTLSPQAIEQTNKDLRAYFHTGATKSIEWRKEQLRQLRKLVLENEQLLSEACRDDLGKPAFESWFTGLYLSALAERVVAVSQQRC